MESQPESNPTIVGANPKYEGIGRMLIAFGIKLSIDNGFAGDIVLEAKKISSCQTLRTGFRCRGAAFLRQCSEIFNHR